MYDFWYVLGSTVIYPELSCIIAKTNEKPSFILLKERYLVETVTTADNTTSVQNKNTIAPGILKLKETDAIRNAIALYLRKKSASSPPVSVYTAGRMSQFVFVPGLKFEGVIANANESYKAAVKGYTGDFPPTFPAVLGLCLCDEKLTKQLLAPSAELDAFCDEFGLSRDAKDTLRQIIFNYLSSKAFASALKSLLRDYSPWQGGCTGEHYFFWIDKDERAIV